MDKQDVIAKIANGELKTVEDVNQALIEVYGKGKKVKNAMGYAKGKMKSEGQDPDKNLSLYLINFDRGLNPSESTEYDPED